MMKKLIFAVSFVLCFAISLPLLAVTVSESDKYIVIETTEYTVHWNKEAQMGYMQAFVGGGDDMIGEAGRAFYHSSDYGGWSDWGALVSWEIVEEAPGRVTIRYESADAKTKEYTCVATYHDSVPYIKHELTITNTGATTPSFASGHEPMFEVNVGNIGMETFDDPFPHAVYAVAGGSFGATYGPEAESAGTTEWGGNNPGRMQLIHNNQADDIAAGESDSVIYYVAFGTGGIDEGHTLAAVVQDEPSPVSPAGSLTTKWGSIRSAK